MKKKEHLDRAMIESAEEEFVRHGVDRANMDTIAASAGVTKKTLYKYYKSKDELYDAILMNLLSEVEGQIHFPFDPSLDLKAQLSKMVEIKIGVSSLPHTLKVAKILAMEQVMHPKKDSTFLKQMSVSRKNLESWFRKCQDHKLTKKDVNLSLVTDLVFSLVEGFFIWPIVLGEKTEIDQRDQIQEYIVDSIYELLRPERV